MNQLKLDIEFGKMSMETLECFNEAKTAMSLPLIAEKLGLHVGTLNRWESENRVPPQYINDFNRILGKCNDAVVENASHKGKDQYFTKPAVAKKCWNIFLQVAKSLQVDLAKYHFIEPSAGRGCFFDLLPKDRRTGVDIDPVIDGIIKSDYLLWQPKNKKPCIVIGNPPFGLRGHLALKFINHSAPFADMVAFILPQLFDSDGKGVPSKRVKGYKLAYSQKIEGNAFALPNGEDITVHTLFQVWSKVKTELIPYTPVKTCDTFIRVYSLSDGGTPASTRNKAMINNCDVYLPSTCFSGMDATISFDDLPHKRGYGVVIHKNKQKIKKLLLEHDWTKTAFYSTNSAMNLRTSLIQQVVINKGYTDD